MELQEYLEQQLSGGQVDSSGSFSMDLSEAREKLQQYRLPAPNYYLLKLVQAAAVLQAPSIRFRLGTWETLVTFTTDEPGELDEPNEILNGLTAPYGLADGALRHLVVGLGAALAMEPLELVWLVRKGRRGLRLRITEDEVVSDELCYEAPIADGATRCNFYLRRKSSWKFWRGAQQRADNHKLLAARCRWARLSVLVDGRDQRATWDHSRFDFSGAWYKRRSLAYNLVELYELDEQGPMTYHYPLPHAYDYDAENGWHEWKMIGWNKELLHYEASSTRCLYCRIEDHKKQPFRTDKLPERLTVKAAYALPLNLEGPTFVAVVKDSVLLNYSEHELGCPGLVAHLDGRELQLDLTDFQVVDNESLQQILDKVARQGRRLFTFVGRRTETLKPLGIAFFTSVFHEEAVRRLRSAVQAQLAEGRPSLPGTTLKPEKNST